jgi:hypothetical protein
MSKVRLKGRLFSSLSLRIAGIFEMSWCFSKVNDNSQGVTRDGKDMAAAL